MSARSPKPALDRPSASVTYPSRMGWGREYLQAIWDGREPPPAPPSPAAVPLKGAAAVERQARRLRWARSYLRAVFEGREPPPPPD